MLVMLQGVRQVLLVSAGVKATQQWVGIPALKKYIVQIRIIDAEYLRCAYA